MKKILIVLFAFIITTQISFAKEDNDIYSKAIKYTKIPKGSVYLSFKNVATGKTVKQLNDDVMVSPASTQKILTYLAALNTLGEDYNFSTKLYKSKNGDYFLVLGADPYLVSGSLDTLISKINIPREGTLKNFYIDDSILDNNNWGEGWQWDDSLNIHMPKFGAYNIDRNLYTIVVKPTVLDCPANIFTEIFYPTVFINKTITSRFNNLRITKEDNDISPDALTVTGDVEHTTKIQIPINYLRRYFILRLDDAFSSNKITYTGKYEKAKLPANSELIAQIDNPIENATVDVLKNSNNMVAETVFKLAGGKYTKNMGTHAGALAMFNNYCNENKIDCSNVRLTDGSGVSKNNLITADFMTEYLVSTLNTYDYEKLKALLPTPGEGTLKNRLPMLKDKLYAKTGTLSNISGITGYLETENGNTYAFAIYVNDGNSSENDKKLLEEIILREAYKKL